MKLRLSEKEQQFLDYLKQQKPSEYRGSWQQVIRHVIDKPMIKAINSDDHPFVFKPVRRNYSNDKSDTSNNNDDSESNSDTDK